MKKYFLTWMIPTVFLAALINKAHASCDQNAVITSGWQEQEHSNKSNSGYQRAHRLTQEIRHKPAPSNYDAKDNYERVQCQVIGLLQRHKNHQLFIRELTQVADNVLTLAACYNLSEPEVNLRVRKSLDSLPKSTDIREFIFHVATIEHLLNDVQGQSACAENRVILSANRSAFSLARAFTKYVDYLAPTQGEIALIIDLARYISDVTLKTNYLSQEMRDLRITQFWQTINNLSHARLAKMSAEQVIDNVCYVAARATYALGAYATFSVIKNIKQVAFSISRSTTLFAKRLDSSFNKVFGECQATCSCIEIFEKNAKHIFRNAPGHLEDSFINRKMLLELTSDSTNLLGKCERGNEWYARTLVDGKQLWASVRAGFIRNAGLNDGIHVFNLKTGLSRQLK